MTPGTKRTIITSKTTGRRYFLVRSSNRPSGRRYYVCTNPTCKSRVSREADLYCKAHAQEQSGSKDMANNSIKSDQIDEHDSEDNGELIEEETPTKTRRNTKLETSRPEELKENENNDSLNGDDVEEEEEEEEEEGEGEAEAEANETIPTDTSTLLSPESQSNRQVQTDERTGARTFRDSAGRRRYLCTQDTCANVLKRQSDLFCRIHTSNDKSVNNNNNNDDDNSTTNRRSQKRHSAPPISAQPKANRFRSPFQTTTTTTVIPSNGTNGNQSDEYETPKKQLKKTPQRPGTTRSFRDASGKLRFLCSISTCNSRVARQSDYFCKRHQIEMQSKPLESNGIQPITTTNGSTEEKKVYSIEEMDVHTSEDNTPSHEAIGDPVIRFDNKKRKRQSSPILSAIPADKIVIATTALLEDQWSGVLSFLRKFPQVQLSTNLNVNNSTTHLLVDDSENQLHCTITKKIVQAAVRHHIFILSVRWLTECMRSNVFVDEHPYEMISDSHTTLRLSEQDLTLTNNYLFGQTSQLVYAFAIECRQCQGSINRSELMELIQLTGAQIFQNEQAVDVLIVLCDINDKNLNKIKEKYLHAPASNIKYVTSDFLLKSIIKFEIQDIEKYSL